MTNIFNNLWDIAINMITTISDVWYWLNTDLIINIPITIPVIFPDGINFSFGFPPIWLLGGGIITLIVFWVVFK